MKAPYGDPSNVNNPGVGSYMKTTKKRENTDEDKQLYNLPMYGEENNLKGFMSSSKKVHKVDKHRTHPS